MRNNSKILLFNCNTIYSFFIYHVYYIMISSKSHSYKFNTYIRFIIMCFSTILDEYFEKLILEIETNIKIITLYLYIMLYDYHILYLYI